MDGAEVGLKVVGKRVGFAEGLEGAEVGMTTGTEDFVFGTCDGY